jgi:GTP-binding protein YchF
MGFNCGIVGLPNVGKSTLFNALTATAAAAAENYPFTTIEPNVGRVAVPDPRLAVVAKLAESPRAVPTPLEFVDIAGLVRGASRGEGLGNKFLAHIREVDAIIHVLRCFVDPDVAHLEGSIDPVRDAETVETELMLADLESVERRIEAVTKKARGGDKEAPALLTLLERAQAALGEGRPGRSVEIADGEEPLLRQLQLLTAKPVLLVCNVEEEAAATGNAYSQAAARYAEGTGAGCVVISAAIEAEVAQLEDEAERREFLAALGLEETGLARVIRAGYALLDLVTFFTANEKEARAWTVKRGTKAPAAGGVVHTDFQRGFIGAEVIAFDDLVACGGEHGAKDAGKMHIHGKDYVVADGDLVRFRFNV